MARIWKKIIEHNIRVLILSTALSWNSSYSEKNWARYYHKCT